MKKFKHSKIGRTHSKIYGLLVMILELLQNTNLTYHIILRMKKFLS